MERILCGVRTQVCGSLAFRRKPLPRLWRVGWSSLSTLVHELVLRQLTKNVWAFVLLGAWAVHPKVPALGGSPLFLPVVTQQEVRLLLLLLALVLFLRQRWFIGWVLVSAALFFHALLALHFALCFAPALILWMVYRRQFTLDWLGGLGLFALCALVFRFLLAPGSFSADEARIFIAAEGNMSHVSVLNENPLQWVKLILLLGLTSLAVYRFWRQSEAVRLIWASLMLGSVIALALSVMAIATREPFSRCCSRCARFSGSHCCAICCWPRRQPSPGPIRVGSPCS